MNTIIHPHSEHNQQQKGIIKGYASLFDVMDRQRDRVTKGAFAKSLRAWRLMGKMPKMLWQHDPQQPLGVWTSIREDEQGLYVEGKLALGVAKADEAYLLLKEGALDGLSIGFRPIVTREDKIHKARILLDVDLLEISLVTFGANAKAIVSNVKTQ